LWTIWTARRGTEALREEGSTKSRESVACEAVDMRFLFAYNPFRL
jgi:hypothetical protein